MSLVTMSSIEHCRHSNWHEFHKHSHIDMSKVEWKNWSSRASFLMCKDVNALRSLNAVSVWKFSYVLNPSDRRNSLWSFIVSTFRRDVVKKYHRKGFGDRCTRQQTLWHYSTSRQGGNFFSIFLFSSPAYLRRNSKFRYVERSAIFSATLFSKFVVIAGSFQDRAENNSTSDCFIAQLKKRRIAWHFIYYNGHSGINRLYRQLIINKSRGGTFVARKYNRK